jgi:hypothetical protein
MCINMTIQLFWIKDTRKSVLLTVLVSLLFVTSVCAAVLLGADNDRHDLKQELARILGKDPDEVRDPPPEARIDPSIAVRIARIVSCYDTSSPVSDNCTFTSALVDETASAEAVTGVITPLGFGTVLLVAIFASKLGGSAVFFFSPLVFVTAGIVLWARTRGDDPATATPSLIGAGVLVGCGVVVAVCGLVGGALVESPTFWASIAVAAAIAAPLSRGVLPLGRSRL